MSLRENRLPADDSDGIACLICFVIIEKAAQFERFVDQQMFLGKLRIIYVDSTMPGC